MRNALLPIGVIGAGGYLPERVRDNHEMSLLAGTSESWILERTGIRTRHVAAPHQAASDLAALAAVKALASAGIDAADLGLIIVTTTTPDELGPAIACRVQAELGAHRAVAFDVSGACSGYLFAARVAHDWLSARPGDGYALIVGAEVYSRFLNHKDRATSVLFGDGAGATILGPVAEGTGFTDIEIRSDGTGADTVLIPAGGSRRPADRHTLADHGHHLQMNGRAVADFIRDVFPRSVKELLSRAGRELSDIDLVVPHQPNPKLLQTVAQDMGVTDQQLMLVGDRIGNIGGACVPFALAEAAASGRLVAGDQIMLAAFGAGLTWGTSLLGWSGTRALPTSSFPDATGIPAQIPEPHTAGSAPAIG
ncbi:ketoacyl-ACP synthase III [Streptomyces sp. NPDC005065]|uniref:3-oxoacyl-ACP synthase III family protein n=1 Tax=unclassified Streptomyces TaxID=2593676 RepID=UPI0033AAD5FB